MTRPLKWVRSTRRRSGRFSYQTKGYECQIDAQTRIWVYPGALRRQWFWTAFIFTEYASAVLYEYPGPAHKSRQDAEAHALEWYDRFKGLKDIRDEETKNGV